MSFSMGLPWSSGEEQMHQLLRVPNQDNPTSSLLTPQASFLLQRAPLLAVGTVDDQGRPWTTVWGGEPGFSQSLGSSIIGTRTIVDRKNDPVVQILIGDRDDGEIVKSEGPGKMVAGLTIDLAIRKRVKIYGRMVAAALDATEQSDDGQGDAEKSTSGQIQLVVRIEQSLGNCPKYLNKKDIRPSPVASTLLSRSANLTTLAIKLLQKSDLFFISSANADYDMDTNHRGGPPGFVRVLRNDDDGAELVYPEYSGNRLYQTLGNLLTNPVAGLVFPDFDSGDVLYVTGTTEVVVGSAAAEILPRSNLVVKIKIVEALYVQKGLPFRGTTGEFSPYNPNVRLLAKESSLSTGLKATASNVATLVKKTQITGDIYRFRFTMSRPEPYRAGQWVALDFSEELDIGYSHMRDDDPRSLNDDFIRTFTISSHPDALPAGDFEVTLRSVGSATAFLCRQNERSGLEIPLRGIGGDFVVKRDGNSVIPFVAGGIGITPLLAELPDLPLDRLRLFWSIRAGDLNLALDTLKSYPGLNSQMTLFVTGNLNQEMENKLTAVNARFEKRRMLAEDLRALDVKTWYFCTGSVLQKALLGWLVGRTLVFEDFNF
ncbi:putative oxidoreductase [Lophium mytilinum]|uniref:Putative oxidoreductase n=1 Tax=Lophium mytilinum TaxID=390894 RepID=A0A6A6QSB2_9PEZI|nr:putative oxidoreductase [Lophium mytilinum]